MRLKEDDTDDANTKKAHAHVHTHLIEIFILSCIKVWHNQCSSYLYSMSRFFSALDI
jgi:hypothetical protein